MWAFFRYIYECHLELQKILPYTTLQIKKGDFDPLRSENPSTDFDET